MLLLVFTHFTVKPFKPYSALLVTSYCALCRKDGLCACRFCVSRMGGTGGCGWGHSQGDMYMVAARLGSQSAMVGTRWANSCPGCMDRLRKRHSHLVGGSFLAGKVAWALSGCLTIKSADYCMLITEWAWLRSRVCLLRLGFSFGVRAWTEMEIRCVKVMYRLKLVSSEKNSGFKGIY